MVRKMVVAVENVWSRLVESTRVEKLHEVDQSLRIYLVVHLKAIARCFEGSGAKCEVDRQANEFVFACLSIPIEVESFVPMLPHPRFFRPILRFARGLIEHDEACILLLQR